jgi:hypothetical protein
MLHATLTAAAPRRSHSAPSMVCSPPYVLVAGPYHLVSAAGVWSRTTWLVLREAIAAGEALREAGGWIDFAGDLQPVPSLATLPTRRDRDRHAGTLDRRWAVHVAGRRTLATPEGDLHTFMHTDTTQYSDMVNDRRLPVWPERAR